MKILIDFRMIKSSGIGTFLGGIIHYMSNNRNDDCSISFLSNEIPLEFVNYVDNIDITVKPFSIKELVFPISNLTKYFDVFFTPNYNIPYGITKPVVGMIHDMVFFDVDGITSPIGKIFRKWYIKRAYKKMHTVLTVSNFSKERIEYHLGTEKEIIVVENAVSENIKQVFKTEINSKPLYNFEYFVYVGNIKPHKNLSFLIDSFLLAKRQGLSAKLLIVGSYENFKSSSSRLVGQFKGEKDIIFTGKISDAQLVNIIHHSITLVQPSLYEGFGIPPLEAIYIGKKPIISDIPVFREIYGDLPVVFFSPTISEQLVEILLSSPKQNFNLTREQAESASSIYSFERSATAILNILSSVNLSKR